MNLFEEHGPDCTPLIPCGACEIVAWLKSKLSAEDFASLVERVADLNEVRPKRAYRRRSSSIEPEAA